MKFWWSDQIHEVWAPYATCEGVGSGGDCYVTSLLTDDGGMGYETTITESEAVIAAMKEIRAGLIESYSWSRESFCADICRDSVKISSQYCEDYFDIMKFEEFEKTLNAWRELLMAGPEGALKEQIFTIHPTLCRPPQAEI
jgi:hypothetical protein